MRHFSLFLFLIACVVASTGAAAKTLPSSLTPSTRIVKIEVLRPDSSAIFRMLADSVYMLETRKKELFGRSIRTDRLKGLLGKKLKDPEDIVVAKQIIHGMQRRGDSNALKAMDEIAKGKFDKKCRQSVDIYYNILQDSIADYDSLLTKVLAEGPQAVFSIHNPPAKLIMETVENPMYHKFDANVNYDLRQDWAWVHNESGEPMTEYFPTQVEYKRYASHPQYRVKAYVDNLPGSSYGVFDENGNLVAVSDLPQDYVSNLDSYSSEVGKEFYRQIYRKAYEADYKNITSYTEAVNDYIRNELGYPDGSEEYSELGELWLRQVREDFGDVFMHGHSAIRLSPTAFRVIYLDKDGEPEYYVDMDFSTSPSDPYNVERSILVSEFSESLWGPDTELTVRIGDPDHDRIYSLLHPDADSSYADISDVFRSVEQMPQFPGGEVALMSFISHHIVYPANAAENGIEGRVVVQFVVTKTGSIGQVEIVRSADPELDREAVRVVKLLPRFKPATILGEPVDVSLTLPINFGITNE